MEIQEFIATPEYRKIDSLVRSFKLNEPIEDTKQDILVKIISSDYLNKFNPDTSSFLTYVYGLAKNVCITKYKRSKSNGGKSIEGALLIRYSSGEDEVELNTIFEDSLKYDSDVAATIEYEENVHRIRKVLRPIKTNSKTTYNGSLIERSLLNTFNLLEIGFSPAAISIIYSTTVQFVHSLISKIREELHNSGITANSIRD